MLPELRLAPRGFAPSLRLPALGVSSWGLYAALSGTLLAVYYALPQAGDAQSAVYLAISVSTFVAMCVGVWRHRPVRRRAWIVFGAGMFLWTAGDAYWECYRFILHAQAPFP